MKMDNMWDESLGHRLKVERNLNFSTISNEEDEYGFSRKKTTRDPMSHRIIEKRRRDRMNNCLADLSRLVPTNYLKKGRGRIEKTEIIEMAIKHLKHLQAHPCKDPATCEVAKTTEQDHKRQYRLGYHECLSETLRFLVEIEGLYAGDGICVRLVSHLQKHYDKVTGGMCYTQALGLITSEEKTHLMDVETENGSHVAHSNHIDKSIEPYGGSASHSPERRFMNKVYNPAELLKQEHDANSMPNNNYHEPSDFQTPLEAAPVKVTSQLREMLQNPGPLKEQQQEQTCKSSSSTVSSVITSTNLQQPNLSKNEEVYKFKNNIKYRFNNDLRHLTSSPTDSHSDRLSLPDEVTLNGHYQESDDSRLVVPMTCNNGSYSTNGHFLETELTVKIPASSSTHHLQWENGSSCGSNPSTPPVPRSNGSTSSSGYSTNGDFSGPKFRGGQNNQASHSPALSPYSRTPPEHNLNRSPSPSVEPPQGVPIFALHPKGSFYIPMTVDASFLAPYLIGLDEIAPILHPISICVNFSFSQGLKAEKLNGKAFHSRTYTERMNERLVYS